MYLQKVIELLQPTPSPQKEASHLSNLKHLTLYEENDKADFVTTKSLALVSGSNILCIH